MQTILDSLYQASKKLREIQDLEILKQIIIREGTKLSDSIYGSIYLHQNRRLERAFSTIPLDLQEKIKKKTHLYHAFRSKQILQIKVQDVLNIKDLLVQVNVKTIIIVPLIVKKKCIGVLSFSSHKDEFSDDHIKVLRLYAHVASYSIKHLYDQMELQNALQIRDFFISMTAHEFRTPLTTVSGYLQLTRKKLKSLPSEKALTNWAQEMSQEVQRLVEMTDELLQISRIRSGKFDYSFSEVPLITVINNAIKRFVFTFPGHKVKFRNAITNDIIIGDPDKLVQLFTNLLENAGKFSSEDKPVEILIKFVDGWYKVSVKDHGRGIPKKDVKKIFDTFVKASNSDEEQGMGLGLFICKNIVQAHQGKMDVKSELGKGTEFIVMFPDVS